MNMLHRAIFPAAAVFVAVSAAAAQPFPPVPAATAPFGRDHPLAGRIVQTGDGAAITPERLAQIAAERDFVLLGEKHDNPDHHRLQAWVIDALVARGRRPAVAMEMLDADQSQALTTHLRQHPQDATGLGAAVGWAARGWPDWSIYAPIAEAALRAALPIAPADLARADRQAVGRDGIAALAEPSRARLQRMAVLDAQQSASLALELRDSHCGHVREESLPRMILVQSARDAHMAAVLIEAATLENASGAVLIAGAGHVRVDRGVPWHLRQRAPQRSIAAIAFIEVDDSRRDIADYALADKFDFAWFTPRHDDEDPCAKFRDSLQRLRRP
jgi:uncharacterized iron-regulated protein